MQYGAVVRWALPTLLRTLGSALTLTAALLLASLPAFAAGDPFADEVVAFTPGAHAGFGTEPMVLGPPMGGGALQGSMDTLSLGDGGSIVVRFDPPAICDRPGPDFIVFENAFHAGSESGPVFAEVGIVAVSEDGTHFVGFPYDAETFAGLAGKTPVYSNPTNGIDPTDPAVAGGDAFDLATVGLASIKYVRITDPGDTIADPGNRVVPGISGGFDLDAIAAIHTCEDAEATATPSPSPAPTTPLPVTPTETVQPTATPTWPLSTPTPSATVSATNTSIATFTPRSGDVDGDGKVDGHDLSAVIDAIFDAPLSIVADANHDGVIAAADCVKVMSAIGGAN